MLTRDSIRAEAEVIGVLRFAFAAPRALSESEREFVLQLRVSVAEIFSDGFESGDLINWYVPGP